MKKVGITTGVKKILKAVHQFCSGEALNSTCIESKSIAKKRKNSTAKNKGSKKSKGVDGTAIFQPPIKSFFSKEKKTTK